ncbi:MAG TPA: homoserine O-acetyltransferase [Pyrinomonadaceae bacterium]|nr:homoserine O-acetyltransferase [Pyrinomonadaceae bacterium]
MERGLGGFGRFYGLVFNLFIFKKIRFNSPNQPNPRSKSEKYMKVFEIDFFIDEPFTLESGEILPSLELRCTIYGQLNADKSNAVLVFHALTGSSRIADWWKDLIGDGKTLDTAKNAYICVNYLGSCYGSTSGSSLKNRRKKHKDLPVITTRDIVRTNVLLTEYLGIKKFKSVIGGSVGGMLALQLVSDFPEISDECVAIGATPLSTMALALNHIQRQALSLNDLGLARQIAMLSYKSAESFGERFGRKPNRNGENPSKKHENRFDIGGYLDHQAEIFNHRFEIESYKIITKAMDLFDLTDEEIRQIRAKVTLVGISSDWLFLSKDVEKLAEKFEENGVETDYLEIVSDDGHDAFLSDIPETSAVLEEIFGRKKKLKLVRCAA